MRQNSGQRGRPSGGRRASWRCGKPRRRKSAELAGGGGGVGEFAVLANQGDERLGGAGEAAVAAVDETELAPKVDTFDGEELDFAGFHVILRKALADDGEAGIGGDEALNHAGTGQIHGDVDARTVR